MSLILHVTFRNGIQLYIAAKICEQSAMVLFEAILHVHHDELEPHEQHALLRFTNRCRSKAVLSSSSLSTRASDIGTDCTEELILEMPSASSTVSSPA